MKPELITLKEGTDNVVDMFFIGSKPTIKQIDGSQFQIPNPQDIIRIKDTYGPKIKGKGFIIQPELLAKRRNGHFFANPRTYENLVKGYLDPVRMHGVFTGEITGPYSYNDGTPDIYLKASVHLNHDKAAAVMLEHGEKAAIPFAISPHIWPTNGEGMNIKDFDFVGSALVDKGAYGNMAVVSKLCKGAVNECIAQFKPQDRAAALYQDPICHCDNCQGKMLEEIFNSRISYAASNNLDMTVDPSKVDNLNPPMDPAQATKLTPEPSGDVIKLSKEQYAEFEQYKKDSEDKAKLQTEVEQLKQESKINALNRMFPSDVITDPNARQVILDEYAKLDMADVRGLEKFLNDYNEKVLPLRIEQAKKIWEAEKAKTETPETNSNNDTMKDNKNVKKGKDVAAASLRPEPEKKNEDNKDVAAASNKPINKAGGLREMMGWTK